MLGQLLARKVLDDEQIGLQVLAQRQLLLLERLLRDQVPDQIEDRAAQDPVALLDRLVADGLGAVRFADYAGRGIVGTMSGPGLCRAR